MKCAIFCLLAFGAFGSSRGATSKVKLDIKRVPLHVPCLDDLKDVLNEELSKNYAEVSVEVVDCPDLKQSPFNLAASGLGGNPEILDMGGPSVHPDFAAVPYNLDTIVSRNGGCKKSFCIGAAQGPSNYPFGLSEIVVNVVLNSPASFPGSIAALSNSKNDDYYLKKLPGNDTGTTFVGNVLVSEGKPGNVLKVHVKKRTGSTSAFSENIQQILAKRYKGKLVGLGGIFLSEHGKVKQHVLESGTSKFHFLFYNMSAPLVSVGVIVSAETDLQFSPTHFHGFSNHKAGGHYHEDVTPDEIEYLGYFTPAKVVSRVKAQSSDPSLVSRRPDGPDKHY